MMIEVGVLCLLIFLIMGAETWIIAIVAIAILFGGGKKIPKLIRSLYDEPRELLPPPVIDVPALDCLVVTRDRAMGRDIVRTVRHLFRHAVHANDRDQVAWRLHRLRPLIAIVDLDLPDYESFYLMTYVRNTTRASIIALTSERSVTPGKSVIGSTGRNLAKPFSEQQLLDLIREMLRHRSLPRVVASPLHGSGSTSHLPRPSAGPD